MSIWLNEVHQASCSENYRYLSPRTYYYCTQDRVDCTEFPNQPQINVRKLLYSYDVWGKLHSKQQRRHIFLLIVHEVYLNRIVDTPAPKPDDNKIYLGCRRSQQKQRVGVCRTIRQQAVDPAN